MALNLNVGVLGHVDCGKTSLVKALSSVLSTASLDKNPQSRERGITLDLGFSAFTVAVPDHLPKDTYSSLQFTLVDCPGHASLIRTIIGGAQILDMMLLVVDVNKGMQAQTVECVVIAEAVMAKDDGSNIIVVLNKIDLIPEAEREQKIDQAKRDITAQLARTKLSRASIVCCAAVVGGEKIAAAASRPTKDPKRKAEKGRGGHGRDAITGGKSGRSADRESDGQMIDYETASVGVAEVAAELTQRARLPDRRAKAPLYFAFDHCFSVRGVGTILTGTVLAGEVKVNQFVELPALRLQKKVKSMQMFRKPVTVARAGDRVGICLSGLDAKLLERGVAAAPGSIRPVTAAVALVRKVSVFSGLCRSGAYYHVSLGHATAMATVTFFGAEELKNGWRALIEADTKNNHSLVAEGWEEVWSLDDMASLPFPWGAEFAQQSELLGQARVNSEGSVALGRGQSEGHASPLQYCLLQFHSPVITPPSSVVLGSRLDSMASGAGSGSTHADSSDYLAGAGEANCRIAFYGRLVGGAVDDGSKRTRPSDADGGLGFGTEAGQLKLFNEKVKTGCVFRVGGGSGTAERGVGEGSTLEVYGKDLFKKETNMSPFVGMLVQTEAGATGRIESAFGKAGRFKASFPRGTSVQVGDKLLLKFRKYVRDPSKTMDQSYLRKTVESNRQSRCESTTRPQQHPSGVDTRSPAISPVAKPAGNEREEPLREGFVDSIKVREDAACVAVCSGLFTQQEDIREMARLGMAVLTLSGVKGTLLSPFGKMGKCKVEFAQGGSVPVQVGDRVYVPR